MVPAPFWTSFIADIHSTPWACDMKLLADGGVLVSEMVPNILFEYSSNLFTTVQKKYIIY